MKQTKFQRIKCFFGFHDIKLESVDVVYQLYFQRFGYENTTFKRSEWWWVCKNCKYEKRAPL